MKSESIGLTEGKKGDLMKKTGPKKRFLSVRDVPLAKNPSMGTAQQRLFLVLKVVLHAVVVIQKYCA